MTEVLSARGLAKSFGAVIAADGVDIAPSMMRPRMPMVSMPPMILSDHMYSRASRMR